VGTAAPPLPAPRPAPSLGAERLRSFVAREGLLLGTAALFIAFWSLAAADSVVADSWLTLVGGREIAAHGIPHSDAIALISHGRPWIDQQWLAQLAYWGTYRIGGLRLDLFLTTALELAALVLAFVAARRRGGADTPIAGFALVSVLYLWTVMRAQAFSHLLFVVLLLLLAAESRRPTRRVWLALPLLALWANIHGAVVVGAALTALLGACELLPVLRSPGRAWLRPAALVVLPWPLLFATPYGLEMVPYYRATLGNSLFRQFQTEWMPPQLASIVGASVFLLAGAAVFLVARKGSALTWFELGALAVTLLGALTAMRSAPWLAYACLIFLPALASSPNRRLSTGSLRLRFVFAGVLGVVAFAAVVATITAPESRFLRDWPAPAASAVDRVLREDPHARVFASHQYADWLLFTEPSVRNRVAFDGRWEILTHDQTLAIIQYLWQWGPHWQKPTRGYRLLVLDPHAQKNVVRTLDARRLRVLYRDKNVVVYDRETTSVSSR
jgi:hypothetical protein